MGRASRGERTRACDAGCLPFHALRFTLFSQARWRNTSSVDRIRAALVGCGTIARVMHLPGLKKMQEMGKVEVVAVCDAVEEAAKTVSETFEIPRYYTDLDAMLSNEAFDLLVNTTPIPNHFAITLTALRAGRHVYTQKPMSLSVEEATILIEEARARGLKLGCAPEHPVRPVVRAIKKLIDEGTIGKVAFARVQSSHDGPEKHNVPRDSTWFYKPGSSPILDLGVHGLSSITSILGPVKRLSCFSGRSQAVRYTTAGPYKGKRIDVEIDDNSLLMLDFGDATFAFLDSTYCVPASLSPRLEIYGSEGTISLTGRPPEGEALQVYRSSTGEWTTVEVPRPALRDLGVLHMVDCLLEGRELVLSGERGRHLVEVMVRAPESAATGRALEIQTTF